MIDCEFLELLNLLIVIAVYHLKKVINKLENHNAKTFRDEKQKK
jgi:hypothetical protein